jgi:hypothetical protein
VPGCWLRAVGAVLVAEPAAPLQAGVAVMINGVKKSCNSIPVTETV